MPGVGGSSPADDVLLLAASGAASSSGSEIVSKDFIKVGAFSALDVTFFPKTKGYVAFARYILADNDLIIITADGYKTRDIPADASSFLSSARVLR